MPQIAITMDPEDFHQLARHTEQWAGGRWAEPQYEGRWETRHRRRTTPPGWGWKWAHWLGPEWGPVLLCRSYLETLGIAYEVITDIAHDFETGGHTGFVLLTDYTPYPEFFTRRD